MRGLSKRLLTMRLTESGRRGFIVRAESRREYVRWELTETGADVVPILLTVVRFGSKRCADEVIADQTPRRLGEIFDEGYIRRTLGVPAQKRLTEPEVEKVRTRHPELSPGPAAKGP